MTRVGRSSGMTRGVQNALGVLDREGPPSNAVGWCRCGLPSVAGTDHDVFSLPRLGRLITYCPGCKRVIQVFRGPPMLTRDDLEGPGAKVFYRASSGASASARAKKVKRQREARDRERGNPSGTSL